MVNVHAEGLLLRPTLCSVQRAAERARTKGVSVEVLVVLDRPDEATRRCVGEFEQVVRIIDADYGDPAEARNTGARSAKGTHVAFVDGDDLVSEHWFWRGLHDLRASGALTIVHPEYSVRFGEQQLIWRKLSQNDLRFRYEGLPWANPWDNACLARREVFLSHPYLPANPASGWGFEDHHWHCETIAAGYLHLTVPETVLFVRMKVDGSQNKAHRAADCALRPSACFAPQFLGERIASSGLPLRVRLRRLLRRILSGMGDRMVEAVRSANAGMNRSTARGALPPWLLEEWQAMNAFDPAIAPRPDADRREGSFQEWHLEATRYYLDLVQECGTMPAHLILTDGAQGGQGTPEVVRQARAVLQGGSPNRVVVLATNTGKAVRMTPFPEGVVFIDFGRRHRDLDVDFRRQLLLRVLLQVAPDRIHVIDSRLGVEFQTRYGKILGRTPTFVV